MRYVTFQSASAARLDKFVDKLAYHANQRCEGIRPNGRGVTSGNTEVYVQVYRDDFSVLPAWPSDDGVWVDLFKTYISLTRQGLANTLSRVILDFHIFGEVPYIWILASYDVKIKTVWTSKPEPVERLEIVRSAIKAAKSGIL